MPQELARHQRQAEQRQGKQNLAEAHAAPDCLSLPDATATQRRNHLAGRRTFCGVGVHAVEMVFMDRYRMEPAVTSARQRLNELGFFGIVPERLAELGHRNPEAVLKILDVGIPPYAVANLVGRDNFTGIFEERQQHP